MRILILTSNQRRHLYLVQKIFDAGHDVLAWAEEKGKAFNDTKFQDNDLLTLHTTALANATDAILQVDNTPPITILARGAFRDNTYLAQAEAFNPDYIIVYGSGIIGDPFLSTFKGRIIGSHQGLPQYFRGSGSNFFAFLTGKANHMGISLHHIDKGIDTGDIIAQYAPEPSYNDTYYSYSAKLIQATIQLTVKIFEQQSAPAPLTELGTLYQRKDFTPQVLENMLQMTCQKSFYGWYQDAKSTNAQPTLINPIDPLVD